MTRNLILAVFALLLISFVYGQQTAVFTYPDEPFNKALNLYKNKQYLAAQQLFRSVKESTSDHNIAGDCAYYIAGCAVRLNQQNADAMMESFVTQYPASLKRNNAFITVADYYFDNGRYAYARKWYDMVDETRLSQGETNRFYFNNGYAFFKSGQYKEAEKYFNRLENSAVYGNQAKYYLGYMAYEGDNYQEATELFQGLEGDQRYNESLAYYQADLNYKLADFEKAIELGLEQYQQLPPREKSELAKIIGESYFNLEAYGEAIPYLEAYKGRAGKWTNTDYYQLGYAHYKEGDHQKAVDEFNKIIDGQDAVAQNAYYHLAESYLELGLKPQALNAFKNASEMTFDAVIREDAFLNYAKLSYEIGNSYQPVAMILQEFIERYPENPEREVVSELLIDSYLTARNYAEALRLLENAKGEEARITYQKVAFLRGLEVYEEGNHRQASELLDRSLSRAMDPYYTARATFWQAELAYQQSSFEESVAGYNRFAALPRAKETPEYKHLPYHLGYAYFKLKDYSAAISSFREAAGSMKDANRKRDAYLRLGDSYFVSRDYWAALEQYNLALEFKGADADYAALQKALCYGFVDRIPQKIAILENYGGKYSGSIYRDDALYELGNTFLNQEHNQDALRAYDQLDNQFPQSGYLAKALLKKALIYNNTGQTAEALDLFKAVAARYPSSEEALQAVSSAKLIYIDQGEVNKYARWVATLDFVELADAELDNAAWQAAEQPFLENRKEVAKRRFADYLRDFPEGRQALRAHFYLAQLLFEEDPDSALEHYLYVLEKDRNEFTEQSLVRAAETYLMKEQYDRALPLLEKLEPLANYKQNVIFAQSNSMKSAYQLEDYQKALLYAERVLENDKIDQSVRNDAVVIVARTAFKLGDQQRAKNAYERLSATAIGGLAAEALYYRAYFLNADRDYQGSNDLIQKLAQEYAGFKEYGAKGLILMAANFYAMEDAFQATYILENVISNFGQYPQIIEEAKVELELIKASEAKTNASVEPGEN